ncbi:DinB family protein [Marinococcus luteus]|uniref:DinB family protein n=1 Tax=Marinococcus luteus TaxID=1122204 RepID=UPI002ACCA08A|nr:DinB family protein [Marinococcus luteus]MDZ5783105.1 DinB family protein [Marinococcus luteus]
MVFDLPGEKRMAPIVGMLYSTVKENNQRLISITKGMTQDELEYKGPSGRFNSTAQLINHLTYVDVHWVYRIKGEDFPLYLENSYGPARDIHGHLPLVQGYSLKTLLSHYEQIINELADVCAQLTDQDLTALVSFGHENEKQATIRWGLWHMADHSRYHQANINLLRQWYAQFS